MAYKEAGDWEGLEGTGECLESEGEEQERNWEGLGVDWEVPRGV